MEFAPMFSPTINSYKRLVDGSWAPVKPTWGLDNRTASFRVIAGSPKSTRLETRCPGADVNPYLAMAAVIAAGMHGVEKGLKLTAPPITGANQGAVDIPRAPRSLLRSTHNFKESAIARDWFGDLFVDHFAATRYWERACMSIRAHESARKDLDLYQPNLDFRPRHNSAASSSKTTSKLAPIQRSIEDLCRTL
jgi:glutamine synthetase